MRQFHGIKPSDPIGKGAILIPQVAIRLIGEPNRSTQGGAKALIAVRRENSAESDRGVAVEGGEAGDFGGEIGEERRVTRRVLLEPAVLDA